ncbi:MAG: hypothetical protein Q8P44_10570 [Dehalococcoidia bacterium]|nr:hypothetical protein [Dehalococcoidia bacterium]
MADEILSQGGPAHRLVRLNCFKEIEVIPLPIANNVLLRKFADDGLVSTEYYSHESGVALRVSNDSIYDVISPFTKRLPDNFWEPIICDSEVTLADLFASNIGDFLVVAMTEPSLKRKVARDAIITAEKALEIVRIILTAHGRYYVGDRIPISESLYYLYRYRKLFKGFQYAWTVAAYAHGKGLSEKIHDHLLSLGTRLEFICRAYDKVAFFSLKTANYGDQSKQFYHLVYFVMLITGVFDSLAHIINEFYHMNINERESISLRTPKDDKGQKLSKFYQLLQLKNASLYEFLAEADTQKDIKTFYPLRDSLQHRELPIGVQLHQISESGKNVFELSIETAVELKKKSDVLNFIIRGNPCFLDPLPFIKWAQEVTITLVNRVLLSINWDSVSVTLPEDIQDKIHASNESYEQGFGQLLGWPEEPLYF